MSRHDSETIVHVLASTAPNYEIYQPYHIQYANHQYPRHLNVVAASSPVLMYDKDILIAIKVPKRM